MNISKRNRIIKDLFFVAMAGLVVATLKNNGDGVAVFITDVIGTFVVTVAIMMVIRHICRETIKEEISLAIEEHFKNHTKEGFKQ